MSYAPVFLRAQGLSARHGFFTRIGGVSQGPYASLNASLSGGDDRTLVMRNRARAAEALGATVERLVGLTQVHGIEIATVVAPWEAGQGPRADGFVTAVPGIALGIVTADCAPVLLADRATGVVGAAHAGWRGAAGGVIEAVVASMLALGATVERIEAAVGPCIAQASYEVGADLRDAVLGASPWAAAHFGSGQRQGHWQFDLAGYCVRRLHGAGVTAASALGVDTMADPARFFSHRRRTLGNEGPIGHQISVIVCEGGT